MRQSPEKDLFFCDHHGYRVSTKECAGCRQNGIIKYDCDPEAMKSAPPRTIPKDEPEDKGDCPDGLTIVGQRYGKKYIWFSDDGGQTVTHKRCSICGLILPKSAYYATKKTRNYGFLSSCNECSNDQARISRSKRRAE